MYLVRKSIDLDFAHHVRGHLGACINIHGHTWKFEVDVVASELDAHGFVVDFALLKRQVLRPCHELLDHAMAVGADTYADIEAGMVEVGERLVASRGADGPVPERTPIELNGAVARYPGGVKLAVFPFSPTSERFAKWLWELADAKLRTDRVSVRCARVYETLHPVQAVAEYWP